MIIREAQSQDLDELAHLAENIFEQEYKKYSIEMRKDYFLSIINGRFNGFYISEIDKNITGFAIYIPIVLVGTAELLQMGVRKDLQGQGIGTRLLRESMDKYIEKLKSNKLDLYALYLTTSEDNPVGQRLYEKCGFERKGRLEDTFIGIGNVEIIMTKILDRTKVYPKNTLW